MRHLVSWRVLDVEHPRVIRWVNVMAHHGGGGLKVTYGSVFFHWQRIQLLMIEDYAYEGTYFRNDLELPLPKGEKWDDRVNKDATIHIFIFKIFILSFF